MYTILIATEDATERRRIDAVCREFPLQPIGYAPDNLRQTLETVKPALAILSMNITEWEGLSRRYREVSPMAVLLLFGDADGFCYETVRGVLSTGACAYLLRPLHERELFDALAGAIARREFLERHLRVPEYRTKQDDTVGTALAQKIERYIRENHTKAMTMEDLTKEFYISEATVNRELMRHTGLSFRKLLINERLEHARRLIKTHPQKSIVEIAAEVGYSDPLYFSRIYKANIGVSPSQDRQPVQKDVNRDREERSV
ncbi:MAG: helix-turn-helix domain-containing protein [Eubacteriales bacterium]|jgi:AraC-like DNA-binding protein